jgi:hypothetical protein
MNSTGNSVPDQSRREALKRFAHYAAAAPAAMVLLDPRESLAKKKGKGKSLGWGKRNGRHY